MDLSHNDIIKGWAFTFDRDNLRWFAIIPISDYSKKGNWTCNAESLYD